MGTENYIRTLSEYQIEQLKIFFLTTKIHNIGREDKTGDLIISFQRIWQEGFIIDRINIPFIPPINGEIKEIKFK